MKFSEEEICFIRNVLGIEVGAEETQGDVLDQIWEEAAEIEVAESNQKEVLSEVGQMAVYLVTKIGNASE